MEKIKVGDHEFDFEVIRKRDPDIYRILRTTTNFSIGTKEQTKKVGSFLSRKTVTEHVPDVKFYVNMDITTEGVPTERVRENVLEAYEAWIRREAAIASRKKDIEEKRYI